MIKFTINNKNTKKIEFDLYITSDQSFLLAIKNCPVAEQFKLKKDSSNKKNITLSGQYLLVEKEDLVYLFDLTSHWGDFEGKESFWIGFAFYDNNGNIIKENWPVFEVNEN